MGERDPAFDSQLRQDVAAILQDFAAVLTEELCVALEVSVEKEALIMNRMGPLIDRFREGEDLSPREAWKN